MTSNSNLYDPKVPTELAEVQEWFASIITRPLDDHDHIAPITPSGCPIHEEAQRFITRNAQLASHQRIELYNQQYWWRLLSHLQDAYPLLTRLFGYQLFNLTIGIPYLTAYPPNHWSLHLVGRHLPEWVEETYHEEDKALILNATRIDYAFEQAFFSLPCTPLDASILSGQDPLALLDKTLYLQPYVFLFSLPYDLLTFRVTFIKEDGDHWTKHDFPELVKKPGAHYVLYRAKNHHVSWKEISAGQYHLLTSFKEGVTVEEACERLEKEGQLLYTEALENITTWFQEWIVRGWLSLIPPQALIA